MKSQIEPRIVAHRSQDPALMNIYFNEEDIYSDFAIGAFHLDDKRHKDATGWHYPGVDKKFHRFPSKTCILAAIYDVTNVGLLEQMPTVCKNCKKEATQHDCAKFEPLWNENNCQDILNAFYLQYPQVLAMRKIDHARARRYGYLWDEWGRILHITAVRSVLEWVISAALREAGNFPIQGTAQGTVKLTMAAVHDDLVSGGLHGDVVWPLLQIHDELLFEVREDMAEEIADLVKFRFETCVELAVPIKAGAAMSNKSWGSVPK
jgi:DNA polymerase-1